MMGLWIPALTTRHHLTLELEFVIALMFFRSVYGCCLLWFIGLLAYCSAIFAFGPGPGGFIVVNGVLCFAA